MTVRKPGEISAAGAYPIQGDGDAGLPTYVNEESLIEADVVAWYTIGFHHLTRPEDWPVLPTVWHQFSIHPYGFFDRNPGAP